MTNIVTSPSECRHHVTTTYPVVVVTPQLLYNHTTTTATIKAHRSVHSVVVRGNDRQCD